MCIPERPDPMLRFKNILCPVDFDPNSLMALRLAADLARENKATLDLLHVVALPPAPEVALPFGQMERAARSRLEKLARQKLDGKVRYQIRVMLGDPSSEVLQVAKRSGAGLIVMATHGRKGLRHLFLGSVAERVVREAPCPVLTMGPSSGAKRRAAPSRKARRAAK